MALLENELAAQVQKFMMESQASTWNTTSVRVAVLTLLATLLPWLLYQFLLPKPIPGIPYHKPSAGRLLGDVPDLLAHIKETDGTFVTFLSEMIRNLDAPVVQLFYSPIKKPIVILADYREATDLMRRKEFDRSAKSMELMKYLGFDHHIRQKTNARWKAQRRLIQDSMSPAFLHGVAAPTIHRRSLDLIELWCTKARIADGRPFTAMADLDHAVLDAVNAFAYGPSFSHSATHPALDVVHALESDPAAIKALRRTSDASPNNAIKFPTGELDTVIRASLDVSSSIAEVQGSIMPSIYWEYVIRRPGMRRARKIKDAFITEILHDAAHRMDTDSNTEKSAVDLMVRRAKLDAQKEGKVPDYTSKVMIDEAFGFVIAGADTTSTSLAWAVKILADNQDSQAKLRHALQVGHERAKKEKRQPNTQEITGTSIPYLDAWIDESLRTGGTIPMIDREAEADTQVLGYHIPKGTDVLCLQLGPGLMSPGLEIDDAKRAEPSPASLKEGGEVKAWDLNDIGLFKPERWLRADGTFDPNAGPHLAFGLGLRSCCGKKLAYLEMRILMTLIVWNFELLPCPKELSGYGSVMIMTSRPRQSFVRLREVQL
ncbi:cytochrome P450 monooxygenase [Bombardia bombarda]|uniref:Cytochrome P450 monooxygenase n=1 Tax=Bombardia bombarda TaxID=252184 RepID=A0AA39X1M6_9PEZI|nr:cytochrome P450 monooxygenase [Bombardia bombarda]